MAPTTHPNVHPEVGSGKGRFKRGWHLLTHAPCSWMLVRVLLYFQAIPAIWSLPMFRAGDKLSQAQMIFGLNKNNFSGGDFWQIFTYSLIHGNWLHLALNGLAIVLLGSRIEAFVQRKTFWLLTLYSGLAGGAMFLLSGADTVPPVLQSTLVGSSAICFGFLVFLTTVSPESKFLPLYISGRTLGVALILANLTLTLLSPELSAGPLARIGDDLSRKLFPDLFKISHACHLGGSLAGFIHAKYVLRPRVSLKSLKRARERHERRLPPVSPPRSPDQYS